MGVPYSPREQVGFEWLCLNLFAGDLREKTIFSMAQKLLEVNLWRKLSMSIPCFPGFCVDFPQKTITWHCHVRLEQRRQEEEARQKALQQQNAAAAAQAAAAARREEDDEPPGPLPNKHHGNHSRASRTTRDTQNQGFNNKSLGFVVFIYGLMICCFLDVPSVP